MIKKVNNASMFIFESLDTEEEIKPGEKEYTYDEMKSFLEEIVNYMDETIDSRKTSINIPYDINASSVIYEFKTKLIPAFEKFNNEHSQENPVYYVWNYRDEEGKYKGTDHFDIKEILKIAKDIPGFIKSLNVGFDSKDQRKFASDMSSGVYGPLD